MPELHIFAPMSGALLARRHLIERIEDEHDCVYPYLRQLLASGDIAVLDEELKDLGYQPRLW